MRWTCSNRYTMLRFKVARCVCVYACICTYISFFCNAWDERTAKMIFWMRRWIVAIEWAYNSASADKEEQNDDVAVCSLMRAL